MITKTYGVYGFIEYEVSLNIGGKTLRAFFCNGSISQQGILPATYSTSSPLVQYCIEHLKSFRAGRIKLIRKAVKDEPKVHTEPQETGEELEEESDEKEVQGDKQVVEVSCLQDAQNYLTEHFNIPGYKARTRSKVLELGRERGVEFEGL